MHLSAPKLRLLPPFLIALLLSTATALPRDAAQQRRLAEFNNQHPLHTTALLAGAATQTANQPAMPTTALRSRVLNPPDDDEDEDANEDDEESSTQILPDRELREKIEAYVSDIAKQYVCDGH